MALNTDIHIENEHSNLVVKRLSLDASEMTPLERHHHANTVLYVLSGAINLQVDNDFYELEANEAHFIEAGKPHQIENLDADVTELLRISFPFNPDDVEILDDPYTR